MTRDEQDVGAQRESESADLRRLRAELEQARKGAIELQMQISAARRASEAQAAELEQARDVARSHAAEIRQARAAHDELRAQLDAARVAHEGLTQQHAALRARVQAQRSELAGLRSHVDHESSWRDRCLELERQLGQAWLAYAGAASSAEEGLEQIVDTFGLRPSTSVDPYGALTSVVPPARLIVRTAGHDDRAEFGRSRGSGLRAMLDFAEEAGLDLDSLGRVLDFGCGCGRLLAAWEPFSPPVEVWGVDLDGDLIDWCAQNIPFVHVRRNDLDPPLDFPAEHFDLVYAASVFTHLTPEAGQAWADEVHRVLKPGGMLVASYQGSHYDQGLRERSRKDYRRLKKEGYLLEKRPEIPGAPATEGSNAYSAHHTADSFARLFAGWDLRVSSFYTDRGPTDFAAYQDVMVFRRPEAPAGPSSDPA